MAATIKTPVTVYVVHHPECTDARILAGKLYDWFRLGHLSGDSVGAGLPIYYRSKLKNGAIHPKIEFDQAELNVVIALVDHRVVIQQDWRQALVTLAEEVNQSRDNKLLLPAAMHESFYRSGPLYEYFNPVRLLDMGPDQMMVTLRRAATEATARILRKKVNEDHPPPLDVFLSHAKRDGTAIAESIRDGVRKFGQLVAWYDANDLPFGADWDSPMRRAAEGGTAAMIATVTDAYPTRPWCRMEASLARTPMIAPNTKDSPGPSRTWIVQPVVAVHQPGPEWVRGVPMLAGVPRMGWNPDTADADTERIVDRLVLEVLLSNVHRRVAQELQAQNPGRDSCFISWVPDVWTLAALRHKLGRRKAAAVKRIIYPGYGMTTGESAELDPVVTSFHSDTKLVSFDEVAV